MSILEPNGEGEAFLPMSREGEVVADGKVSWVLGKEGFIRRRVALQMHARVLLQVQKPLLGSPE